ncbi:MAG: sialidase family protein [Planctomycetota bacterium]
MPASAPPALVLLALCLPFARAQDQRIGKPIRLERPGQQPYRPAPGRVIVPPVIVQQGSFTSVQVNVDANGNNIVGDAGNEPAIAVDPAHPNRFAIGWRQFDTVASDFRQAGWAFSHDGGAVWRFLGVLQPGVFRSDPVLDTDLAGNFFYYSLKGSDFSADMYRSETSAVSWLAKVPAFGGDKPWLIIDKTGNVPGSGNIYVAWSVAASPTGSDVFTRSVDGGFTWMSPIELPHDLLWGTLSVDADSNLYVTGIRGDTFDLGAFVVAKSFDAKNPLMTPTFAQTTLVDLGGSLTYGPVPNPGGLGGQVWIATNHSSGPDRNHVYLLASVDPPGADPLDLHFCRSTDGGATFSAPVRINDDPAGNGAWQWFGTMSAAPSGRIDVIWNDTRNDPSGTFSQLYYSYSTDGGQHWSANVAVSPPWNHFLGYPQQDKIGDYDTMVSDDVGANVAYAATFNGEQDVYYLRIGPPDCNGNGVPDADDIALGTSQDDDADGVPDECETLLLSKLNPGKAGATNAIHVTRATPGAMVTFLYGTVPTDLPIGSCPGARLGILDLHVLGSFKADATGLITLSGFVASQHQGQSFLIQAIEAATCRSSNTVSETLD